MDQVLQDVVRATAQGGQLTVGALAKKFGLWEGIRRGPLLDLRKDKGWGSSPEAIVAQWVFSFCCGGTSLIDAER